MSLLLNNILNIMKVWWPQFEKFIQNIHSHFHFDGFVNLSKLPCLGYFKSCVNFGTPFIVLEDRVDSKLKIIYLEKGGDKIDLVMINRSIDLDKIVFRVIFSCS